MKPYLCPNCGRPTQFEVRVCPGCAFTLGYDPAGDRLLFLGDNATTWRDADARPHDVVVCENNNAYGVCNWLVGRGDPVKRCLACRHNRTIPDLTGPAVPERWGRIEAAKRRLFHTLLQLRLPIETVPEAEADGTEPGLAFDFLYDPVGEETGTVQITTGHEAGLVTLNLLEADDVQREKMRTGLGEPYRTLLGHFRHEVGHYYWARLIEDTAELDPFRALFGSELVSYAESMKKHYDAGAGGAVSDEHVSAYAAMHPWEDFAETFAHLLHIVDALATLKGFGVTMAAWPGAGAAPTIDFDPYRARTAQLIRAWGPYAFAENAIARSMGQPDIYPFHLSDTVIAKLDYINGLLGRAGRGEIAPREPARAAEREAAERAMETQT